jgi:hypothetical protein
LKGFADAADGKAGGNGSDGREVPNGSDGPLGQIGVRGNVSWGGGAAI